MSDPRRALPGVSALLERAGVQALLATAPRALVVDAVRGAIEDARRTGETPGDDATWTAAVARVLEHATLPSLRRVINATGVVLHTNLGRAPLPEAALAAIQRAAAGYSNLEYDLDAGARGSRYSHCVALLRELTGAEDALVVNNNAAALVLALNALSMGDGVAISRGELVEIGGSFRIPDIMARSGARLIEIGTTNRTHLADYEGALDQGATALLKVHRSNFAMEGFVAEVDARDLARLAAARGVPFIHDLGSGLLIPLDAIGLTGEPTAGDAVRAGATVVTMSGDKLLGGPQAGIIVGQRAAVARLRENPLTRALRVDKLTLAALEATLALYRDPAAAMHAIPALAMLSRPVAEVHERAARLARAVPGASVIESDASVGGGAFPSARIPSAAVLLPGDARHLESRLRLGPQPVLARVADDRVRLDLRTVLPGEDDQLAAAVSAAITS